MKKVSKQTQRMEATHDKPAMTMGLDIEAPDESHTPEQKQRQKQKLPVKEKAKTA